MCILCVVQRWSRRVATMLPWLVLPLILLWAFSQLLPPGYRFEVTSPRLACVSVLLLTLFWYEILLPQLSLWRARRSARLREERRVHALELQKLRKTATRRCRNCNNPYRDQNPGGGRFMCSYCGHISKRPVLDLPGPVSPSKNGWICNQDWPAGVDGNGNSNMSWVGARYWMEDRCTEEKSYSGFVMSSWRLFSDFFVCLRWLWRKVFSFGSSRDDGTSDGEHKRSSKRGDNGGNAQESRGEKARRKAEEKRLARLEKEMLEEEERKQREEVTRLVEERRKLRDEKQEAEERSKGATPVGEKERRKETERRRQERRKEKDKGSSKSNSDCEDLDRRTNRETERKPEFDRKSDTDRKESQRVTSEFYKSYNADANYGNKSVPSKTKYFGRMTGGLLSSSRGFTGASFFGRSAQVPGAAPVTKTFTKTTVGMTDQSNASKRDAQPVVQTAAKATSVGDNRNSWTHFHQPVSSQPRPTGLKKSWHQLFNRSVPVSPYPEFAASTGEKKGQSEPHSVPFADQMSFPLLNSQQNFGPSAPFSVIPSTNGSFNNNHFPQFMAGPMPFLKEPEPVLAEEPEHFEDPCYEPDAIALLGPVSKSLDNFPLDLGSGFISSDFANGTRVLKSAPPPRDVIKPSPIESPLSRTRGSEEKQTKSSQFSSLSKANEPCGSKLPEANVGHGAWQMWDTPLVQENLGLGGGPSSWCVPPVNQFNQDGGLPGIWVPQHVPGVDQQNGGTYSPLGANLNTNDLWVQQSPFPSLPIDGKSLFLPANIAEHAASKDMTYGSSNKSACTLPFELSSPTKQWSSEEWSLNGSKEAANPYPPAGPKIGGLFSTNWSFSQEETT